MAEEYSKTHEYGTKAGEVEAKDRGLFDFMGKEEKPSEKIQEEAILSQFEKVKVDEVDEPKWEKEEKPIEKIQEEAILSQFEKVKVDELDEPKWENEEEYKEKEKEERKEENEEKKDSLLRKLQRSDSSSSSSSDEDEGEGEEKKKKREKKGLKEKITGEKDEEEKKEYYDATATIPEENSEEVEVDCSETVEPEGKKGFLEKIKEKLPGKKKTEEPHPVPRADCVAAETITHEGEPKERKGILEKIKEKLPGYHSKTEQVKEKEQSD